MSYNNINIVTGREIFYNIYNANKDCQDFIDTVSKGRVHGKDEFIKGLFTYISKMSKPNRSCLFDYLNNKFLNDPESISKFFDKIQGNRFKSFEEKMTIDSDTLSKQKKELREKIILLAEKVHQKKFELEEPKENDEDIREEFNSNKQFCSEHIEKSILEVKGGNERNLQFLITYSINNARIHHLNNERAEMQGYEKTFHKLEKINKRAGNYYNHKDIVADYRAKNLQTQVANTPIGTVTDSLPPPPAYPLPPPSYNIAPAYTPAPPPPVYVQLPPQVVYAREPQPKKSWSLWSLFTPVKYSLNLVTRFCSFCWSKMLKLFGR